MESKIKFNILITDWYVNIETTPVIVAGGVEYSSDTHASSYINSPLRRKQLVLDHPEHIANGILMLWGEPTKEDVQPEIIKQPELPVAEDEDSLSA